MKVAFDVYYFDDKAKTVALCFEEWTDETPSKIFSEIITGVEEYQPGQFYKRELPCLISLLKQIDIDKISEIIVDSFVILDDTGKYGLGGYLFEYLNKKIPVIGVAKSNFCPNKTLKRAIYRGESKKPLYVSALGIDLNIAAEHILNMAGKYRIPTLLKQVDALTRESK